MLKALLKLFGISKASCSCSCAAGGVKGLEGFVDYVVRSLVDSPDAVKVTTEDGANSVVIRIDCNKEDIGKIVGKRGKTIMAIRSLVRSAAGKMNKQVTVEVTD